MIMIFSLSLFILQTMDGNDIPAICFYIIYRGAQARRRTNRKMFTNHAAIQIIFNCIFFHLFSPCFRLMHLSLQEAFAHCNNYFLESFQCEFTIKNIMAVFTYSFTNNMRRHCLHTCIHKQNISLFTYLYTIHRNKTGTIHFIGSSPPCQ